MLLLLIPTVDTIWPQEADPPGPPLPTGESPEELAAAATATIELRRRFLRRGSRQVALTAIWSRIVIGIIGTASMSFVGLYDTSSLVNAPLNSPIIYPMLCGSHWDGTWFAYVAENGYTYESTHAFFPLYPFLMRILADTVLAPVEWIFPVNSSLPSPSRRWHLALAGTGISLICFIGAAVLLFRLSERHLSEPASALRAALLFCFNPASIFFQVAYSESLFSLLAFSGMLILAPKEPTYVAVRTWRAYSAAYNGNTRPSSSTSTSDEDDTHAAGRGQSFDESVIKPSFQYSAPSFRSRLLASLCFGLATAARSNGSLLGVISLGAAWHAYEVDSKSNRTRRAIFELICVTAVHAFFLFAVLGYGWFTYCSNPSIAYAHEWCNWRIPNIYTYVEHRYWNIGLFSYYEQKQIPNFILAAPTVLMSLRAVRKFTRTHFSFALHLWFLILIAVSLMHIQVVTRFVCSSSPAFFWFAARTTGGGGGKGYFTLLYFALYCALGASMFCAFYPWT